MVDLQGKILDRKYKLVRLIGEGGMGSVWEAEHTRISRRVAVKVMHTTEGDDQAILKRFFLEAQAASAIGHPNIIEIFDVGVEEDGTAFMVMELLNGVALENLLLDRGSLPPGRVVAIILQVLSALHAAHNKGIVHRDLKPDNVFLAVDSRMREDVKLLDFGVAKVLDADSNTLKLTKPGTVLGTPYYLSPEQARGSKDIDARIDIWSLGVMMYEMLSGRLPFEGDTYNEVIGNILMTDVTPLMDVAPGVPFELASVVIKAMSKDRDKRYRNVGEMIKALMPLHDQAGGEMGPASAKAVRDSAAPPPPKGEATESVKAGSGGEQDRLETLSQDLLQTIDAPPGRFLTLKRGLIAAAALIVVVGVMVILAAPWEETEKATDGKPGLAAGLGSGTGAADPVPVGPKERPPSLPADSGVKTEQPDENNVDPKPATVKIRLAGLPPRARVQLGDEQVTTPVDVPLSTDALVFKITAPGYRPQSETVIPDKDKTIKITMKKVPTQSPGKSPGSTPTKKKGWKDNPFG